MACEKPQTQVVAILAESDAGLIANVTWSGADLNAVAILAESDAGLIVILERGR